MRRPTSTRPASRPSSAASSRTTGRSPSSAGVPLLTAMGYDFVPGALAGALALEEAGEDAVRVDVGYYALGMTTQSGSTGTRASLVGASLDDSHAFRDGALRDGAHRPSACARSRSRARSAPRVSVGGAEHLGAPGRVSAAAGGQRLPRLVRPVRAADAGGRAGRLGRHAVPGVREALTVRRRAAGGAGRGPRGRHDARRRVVDRGAGVRRRRRAARRGPPHRRQLVRVHRRLHRLGGARRGAAERVKGAGALGPVEAFGLEELERGCALAGLSRAAA